MIDLASLLDAVNFKLPGGRWQLVQFANLSIIPPFIRHDHQDALTARWTRRIPLIQPHSPAELAADALLETLTLLHEEESLSPPHPERPPADPPEGWTVIDIGSGTGGPVPTMEMLVNHGRGSSTSPSSPSHPSSPSPSTPLLVSSPSSRPRSPSSRLSPPPPIPFVLTDLHPNLDPWMLHASRSPHLHFLPQPLDAANPRFAAISATTRGAAEPGVRAQGFAGTGRRVLRLYCEVFDGWGDEEAVEVWKSTLATSDAVVVVGLAERRIWGLVMVGLEVMWTFLMGVFWFWRDGLHLLCTYVLPILPVTQLLDGVGACLRTRTWGEMVELVERAQGMGREGRSGGEGGRCVRSSTEAYCGEWHFTYERKMYSWPVGYMTVMTGRRVTLDPK